MTKMGKHIIPIPEEIVKVSKVNIETHKCEDGSPVWIDLNTGNWKNPNGDTSLTLEKKAEYVNKTLIRELWYNMWKTSPTLKESNEYAKAINYFLRN